MIYDIVSQKLSGRLVIADWEFVKALQRIPLTSRSRKDGVSSLGLSVSINCVQLVFISLRSFGHLVSVGMLRCRCTTQCNATTWMDFGQPAMLWWKWNTKNSFCTMVIIPWVWVHVECTHYVSCLACCALRKRLQYAPPPLDVTNFDRLFLERRLWSFTLQWSCHKQQEKLNTFNLHMTLSIKLKSFSPWSN